MAVNGNVLRVVFESFAWHADGRSTQGGKEEKGCCMEDGV